MSNNYVSYSLNPKGKEVLAIKVSNRLATDFKNRAKAMNWTNTRLMEVILTKALYPEKKLYQIIKRELVKDLNYVEQMIADQKSIEEELGLEEPKPIHL